MTDALPSAALSHEEVSALFTDPEGKFHFARWSRPIVPVVFGVDDATLATVKGAIEAVVTLADHRMAETDPELGANLMLFFFRSWDELPDVPDLARLLGFEPEGFSGLIARLEAERANQYRLFRFEADGAIRAAFVFLRMDAEMADLPAADLALSQAVQVMLIWGAGALRRHPPLVRAAGGVVLDPGIAGVIRVAYDPLLPAMSRDPAHALRLAARLGRQPH